MDISLKAQKKRLKAVISAAGRRYTPELNIQVNVAEIFEGAGRTQLFYEKLKRNFREIVDSFGSYEIKKLVVLKPELLREIQDTFEKLLNEFSRVSDGGGRKEINFKNIFTISEQLDRQALSAISYLSELEEQEKVKKPKKEFYEEKFRSEKHDLRKLYGHLRDLEEFSKSKMAQASNNPFIVLNGAAGTGKTHLLCDIARERIENGLPTYIFLGEEFVTQDPWPAMFNKFGAQSIKSYLKKIDIYAKSKSTRALIIVDALNEQQAKKVYWSKLLEIKKYKSIGLILSVRTGFEKAVLPKRIVSDFLAVEHTGFAFKEWEAVTKFFSEYGLPLPEIPILSPEFTTPLFLKIFCESRVKKSKKYIKGNLSFTDVFEDYVVAQGDQILENLGFKKGRRRGEHPIWDNVIKMFAQYMADNDTDRIPESIAERLLAAEFPHSERRVLNLLEKFWLLTKEPHYGANFEVVGYDYRFPYQKFSDHLIVRYLLNKYKNVLKVNPKKLFNRHGPLYHIISGSWRYENLVEALSIQVPERTKGNELISIVPKKLIDNEYIRGAFMESLVWRDTRVDEKTKKSKFIKEKKVLKIVNEHILRYSGGSDLVLNTILSVSTVPNHPLNAILLHRHLNKFSMPKKDELWLPFLHRHYNENSAIDRLVNWATEISEDSVYTDRSTKLAGIALAWFLASSNRFLRDRATKALVVLFRSRLSLLLDLLKTFEGVNDTYVLERLYAVAYGCILINPDKEGVNLCEYVYEKFFRRKKMPIQFLLRDYIYGILEVGKKRFPKFKTLINDKHTSPPYGSKWPTRIPSLRYLKRKYKNKKIQVYGRNQDAYGQIWHSLMHDNEGGIADFGNYVVGSTIDRWSRVHLTKKGLPPKSRKKVTEEFIERLTVIQKLLWATLNEAKSIYATARIAYNFSYILEKEEPVEKSKAKEKNLEKAEKELNKLEEIFLKSLTFRQKAVYCKVVRPQQSGNPKAIDLDHAEIQRLIFSRIISLGWDPKLFAEFDTSITDDMAREAKKPERIGKKYQWIAFYEVLARIADNFAFRPNWSSDFEQYRGPWQPWERNIDPSFTLLKSGKDEKASSPWWLKASYKNWQPKISNKAWLRENRDINFQKKLVQVKQKSEEWLNLEGSTSWQQPAKPGEKEYGVPRREVWYQWRAYLVKETEADRFFKWAKKQSFMGGWLPEPITLRQIFLHEYPQSVSYISEWNEKPGWRWVKMSDKKRSDTDFDILLTSENYSGEFSSYDCSAETSTSINLPAKEIVEGMKLKQSNKSGIFIDNTGKVIAFDPSVYEKGPDCLLVRKKNFLKFLKSKKLAVLWSLVGEKRILSMTGSGGWLELGGAYLMKSNGILLSKNYSKYFPRNN